MVSHNRLIGILYRKLERSHTFLYAMPHALQRVLGPSGPRRIWGVALPDIPHLKHRTWPSRPSSALSRWSSSSCSIGGGGAAAAPPYGGGISPPPPPSGATSMCIMASPPPPPCQATLASKNNTKKKKKTLPKKNHKFKLDLNPEEEPNRGIPLEMLRLVGIWELGFGSPREVGSGERSPGGGRIRCGVGGHVTHRVVPRVPPFPSRTVSCTLTYR